MKLENTILSVSTQFGSSINTGTIEEKLHLEPGFIQKKTVLKRLEA